MRYVFEVKFEYKNDGLYVSDAAKVVARSVEHAIQVTKDLHETYARGWLYATEVLNLLELS